MVADGAGFVADAVGFAAGDDAAGDDAAWSGVAGDAEGTAVARGRGGAVGIATGVPAVPAGSLGAAPAAVPWRPAVPWPDTSSATATAATMRRRAATQAARAVPKLVSSRRGLMASRSLARPAGRA